MKNRILILLFALLAVAVANAQTMREEIEANPNRAGGIYCHYTEPVVAPTPAPRGYKPFYISHYGRHGCRYQASRDTYAKPLAVLEAAAAAKHLTPLGEDVLRRLRIIADDAYLREGDLTARGEREHRGIARRMMDNYPEVFRAKRGEGHISCFSTHYSRCILSMSVFADELKGRYPGLDISRESTRRNAYFMACDKGLESIRSQAIKLARKYQVANTDDRAFLERLFGDYDYAIELIKEVYKSNRTYQFFDNMHGIAIVMQDCDHLGISMHDIFTADERYAMWRIMNVRRYLTYGPSVEFGDVRMTDGKPLLRDIIERAEKVVSGEAPNEAATLRFGHDSYIIPLLALMQIEGCCGRIDFSQFDRLPEVWCDSRVTSMAVNVQFVFFRNKRGEVLVKMMHSEREVRLPIASDVAPFYRWEEFKAYCASLYND